MRRLNMKNALIITLKRRPCQCSCHYWQCSAVGLLHSFHPTSCMSAGDIWLLWAEGSSCLFTHSSCSDNLFWRVWKRRFLPSCRALTWRLHSWRQHRLFPSSLFWKWMTLYNLQTPPSGLCSTGWPGRLSFVENGARHADVLCCY